MLIQNVIVVYHINQIYLLRELFLMLVKLFLMRLALCYIELFDII